MKKTLIITLALLGIIFNYISTISNEEIINDDKIIGKNINKRQIYHYKEQPPQVSQTPINNNGVGQHYETDQIKLNQEQLRLNQKQLQLNEKLLNNEESNHQEYPSNTWDGESNSQNNKWQNNNNVGSSPNLYRTYQSNPYRYKRQLNNYPGDSDDFINEEKVIKETIQTEERENIPNFQENQPINNMEEIPLGIIIRAKRQYGYYPGQLQNDEARIIRDEVKLGEDVLRTEFDQIAGGQQQYYQGGQYQPYSQYY